MREASFGDPLFGSDQGDMYQDMMDDQLAVEMSQGKGLGLADMLIRQLSRRASHRREPRAEAPTSRRRSTTRTKQKFIEHDPAEGRQRRVASSASTRNAIIAQAALETGWGTSQPADASGAQPQPVRHQGGRQLARRVGQRRPRTEFDGGVAGTQVARFRAYGSAQDSVNDYVSLLTR